ncbi:uncharacterized protein LOC118434243 [Folsomia candida]|uniref:uncharacterized protein LOC118434243 n=1 Tax=Folsomia candida TaxID=158441 RepID=UPI00160526E0|nr:uncharacterized protein LOC118434243 [Folsomia candida]
MFAVVHFTSSDDDSVQLVPSSWLDKTRTQCRWPSGPKANQIAASLIKSCSLPQDNWPYLPCSFKKSFFDYQTGRRTEKKIAEDSNLSSSDPDVGAGRLRKRSRIGLDNVSAFPFEDYLQFLKSLVRSKTLMLEQVVKRVTEHDNYNFIRDRKIIKGGAVGIKNGFARKYNLSKFSVDLRKGDNCFVLSNDRIVLVDKIKVCSDHRVTVVVKVLCRTDISRYPTRSSKLNIFKCGASVSDRIEFNILDLRQKCVMLLFRNDINSFLCIPMLENYEN